MMAEVETLVRGEVETMLLHGLPQDELETLMLRVFRKVSCIAAPYCIWYGVLHL